MLAGHLFTFDHHSELFWFGFWSFLIGFVFYALFYTFFDDDDSKEPECDCDICQNQKHRKPYDPNDYK
jgi:hypothetical protein